MWGNSPEATHEQPGGGRGQSPAMQRGGEPGRKLCLEIYFEIINIFFKYII